MAKKDFFLIVDTETSLDERVVDFGAVVVDRKGNIHAECAVLIHGIFNDRENHPLFYDATASGLWAKENLNRRYQKYNNMLETGSRMLASVNAVNRWLERVRGKYNPYLTAYNLPFDLDKCNKTDIDLLIFEKRFCLWGAACDKWATSKKYKNFILENHYFNNPTKFKNMTFKTNAEVMARYVLNQPDLADEPHTALEDVKFYELPILLQLVKTQKKNKWLEPSRYNWRKYQAKDHFIAK